MAANPHPPAAIPTYYKGIWYRSQLEAKYALVFDRLNVSAEYEPEARYLKSGNYRPDFYLPKMKVGTWLEVKPYDLLINDRRWPDFAIERQQRLITVYGMRDPYMGIAPDAQGVGRCIFPSGEVDEGDYWLTSCAVCGEIGIEFEGRGARACADRKRCYGRLDADKAFNYDDPNILVHIIESRGFFVGMAAEYPTGRLLSDERIEEIAKAGNAWHVEHRGGFVKWLDAQGLSPADRDAVRQAWGRFQE